jgi:hypothetical protein
MNVSGIRLSKKIFTGFPTLFLLVNWLEEITLYIKKGGKRFIGQTKNKTLRSQR